MADLSDILKTMIAEANAEGPEGMRRVAETILNRAAIRGITPAEVVRQKHQYTGFEAPGALALQAQQDPRVMSAAEAAWNLARQPGDPTDGADHYYNPNVVDPGWQRSMQHTGDYGGHTFYRSRAVPTEALARLLTPQTRDVAMPRPRPTSPSEQIATMFADSFSAPRDAATGSGLDAFLARQQRNTITPDHQVFGNGVERSHQLAAASRAPDLASALGSFIRPQAAQAPRMTTAQQRADNGQNGVSASTQRAVASFFGMDGDPNAPAQGQRAAAIPTAGVGMAPATRSVQSVAMPAVKPATAKIDTVGTMPKYGDIAAMFGPQVPSASGTTIAGKPQDRLPATPGPRENASAPGPDLMGGLDPALIRAPGTPVTRGAPQAPAPAYQTVTERVVNPAWTAAQQAKKIDPVGEMPTWGDFASTFAPKSAVPKASPPQYITVTKKVAVAPAARRIAPVASARAPLAVTVSGANTVRPNKVGGNTSAVQALRNQGYSPSQAYDLANRQSADRARSNATNAPSSDLNDRISSGDMWSAHN